MSRAKSQPAELAILGGDIAFAEPRHVGRPNLGDARRLHERIDTMLAAGWLTNDGPLLKEFERRIAERCETRHCVAMANGTIALEIAIRALDLSGEMIVPSYTFVATAHALQWQAITPVFADIDPRTHLLDPQRVAELITPRTSGIIGVHLWGRACEVETLQALAERHSLALLFDAAHAFDCTHAGRKISSFGKCEVLSFHATKFVNSGEGGAVVTNDDALAEKMRLMRNFGFVHLDKVVHVGTNGKLSELNAALGLTSLDSIDEFVAVNREHYQQYRRVLHDLPGLTLIDYDPRERNNYQYVVVEVDEPRCGLSRDQLVELLFSENVRARRYFWPGAHAMEPYRTLFPQASERLPQTLRVAERVLVLPTGSSITAEDIDTIVSILRVALSAPAAVATALAERTPVLPPRS